MSRSTNPFKPTAGKTPPELIGRSEVLEEFSEGIDNGSGAPGRLIRVTGIRGMGKTVVLNELGSIAAKSGWTVVNETANSGFLKYIVERLESDRPVRGTLEPEVLGVKLGSIDFERKGNSLRDVLGRAAKRSGLLITLDEVQDASIEEIKDLAVAVQHAIREDLDIAFAFAGLSSTIDGVVNSKTLTFLRRAVPFELGPLDEYEVADSLEATFVESGMKIGGDMVDGLARSTAGYPFMVQLVGYYTWQNASRRGAAEVVEEDVRRGVAIARRRFDETVIEPELHHLPPSQLRYLLAMAQDGGESSSSGAVAERMGMAPSEAGVYRRRLMNAGIVDAAAWGKVRFAIPHMGDYLERHRAEIEPALAE